MSWTIDNNIFIDNIYNIDIDNIFHMSQMDKNQIDLERRLFLSRYLKIGLKIIQKFYYILAMEKQLDSLVEVVCHLFYE